MKKRIFLLIAIFAVKSWSSQLGNELSSPKKSEDINSALCPLTNELTCILHNQTTESFTEEQKQITATHRKRHKRHGQGVLSCSVVISEINADNPGVNQHQFIELQRICKEPLKGKPPRLPLPEHKLIILQSRPLAVVFALDLDDPLYSDEEKKSHYFVIGSKEVEKCTIDIQASTAVQSIQKSPDGIELIPTGDDNEYAVILIKHTKKVVRNQIRLHKNEKGIYEPNNNIQEPYFANIIKNNAVDIVIYRRKVISSACTFFDQFFPDNEIERGVNNHVFRDWDPPTVGSEDLSINRCTESTFGFLPSAFRLGKTSPGKPNNCGGSMINLETAVNDISLQPAAENDIQLMEMCEDTEDNESPAKRFKGISEERYHTYIQTSIKESEGQCANTVENGLSFSASRMEIEVKSQLIKRLGFDPRSPDYKNHRFNPEWKEQCKAYIPFGSLIFENHDVQSWLDIDVKSNKCLFSCFACKLYLSGFRVDHKRKSNMETATGFFSPVNSVNLKQITDHSSKNIHISAKQFLTDISAAKKNGEFLDAIKKAEEAQNKLYLPTIRMVRLVYAEILAGVSYRKHPLFVDVVKSFDVNLGIHHYHATAATQITAVISTSFHETLVDHLVSKNLPFSLMVDESTDSQNLSYMICYMQSLEDNYPIVYFYSLILLTHGQTAAGLFKSFKEQIQSDNTINPTFEIYFKSKIVSLATDGASVMRSSNTSFWKELETYLEREIPSIHCFSHKLELSVKRALVNKAKIEPEFNHFKLFEKNINNFYTFYMSRGSKRWLHLMQVADDLQLQIKRIRYHFDLRWSSSYYYVIKSLHDDIDVIRIDLVAIQGDQSFTTDAKNKAIDLHSKLIDKTYCMTIMEYADFVSVYKQISLETQQSSGLLIGKYDIIQRAANKLEILKVQPGDHVSSFLALTSCDTVCALGSCTYEQYDNCPSVIYTKPNKNPEVSPVVQTLTFVSENPIKLSNLRTAMYNSLISELKNYFDFELLGSFELFNPRKYKLPTCSPRLYDDIDPNEQAPILNPINHNDLLVDGFENKVLKVCEFLILNDNDCTNFGADWKVLMIKILTNVELVKNFQEDDLSRFWPFALTFLDLPWTAITKSVIVKALVIPFSSSDCERGFRYVSTLKSNERSRLTPNNLEHLVRIKVNGPQNIDYFQADKYAAIFLRKHVRVDDTSSYGGRKLKPETFKSFFRDSRLF